MIAIELSPDEAVFFECFEAIGKDIGRHAGQSLLQILETHGARKQIPDYEKRPARAYDIQRPGDRTSFIKAVFRHQRSPKVHVSCSNIVNIPGIETMRELLRTMIFRQS
ncbi:hypothetical protein [Bradyrhizobium elkanii]|uniref:hypothetical protein n=1 Tax=Bradyrhizobium elkanii TaxID=29448 RepID=UPI002169A4C9|nr:hypothetical protein [Bradyrhizobium elkanii]MCS4109958.1 hypothetical protein [Bradyrhizobium elkanii]